MNTLTKDVYDWLIESDELEAARFLRNCEVVDQYVDIAIGISSDDEWIISDIFIYVPLKAYKADEHKAVISPIENGIRELGHSQDTHYKDINWISRHPANINNGNIVYDAFISHASEDKESFVRPLAEILIKRGFKIWYDEFTLKVGDSLRQTIDKGLIDSSYGILVLSKAFFEKNWTQYELNGLMAREMDGKKIILPIWHEITKTDVLRYSPSLADKVAVNSTTVNLETLADRRSEVLNQVNDKGIH